MKTITGKLSLVFGAGVLGGLANSIVVLVLGKLGVTAAFGVAIAPDADPMLLYQRLVWGGIWGVLFLLPLWRRSIWLRGAVYSLAPSAVQLLVVFPLRADEGVLGLELGALTPAFVLVFNAVWGLVAAWWVTRGEGPGRMPVQAASNPIQ